MSMFTVFVALNVMCSITEVRKELDLRAPPPEPVGADFVPHVYRGRIVGLSQTTVTIQPVNGLSMREISYLPDGSTREKVYVQDNTQPPLKFVFSDLMVPKVGGQPLVPSGHRATDVQVGDIVYLNRQHLRGVDTCIRIEIERRPGGRVPPAVGDERRRSPAHRWDNKRNAEQFAEEAFAPKWAPAMLLHFQQR